MKIFLSIFVLLTCFLISNAQICIGYDAAGNRTNRQGGCYLPPDDIISTKQAPKVLEANSTAIKELEINFYPNPSTGIFNLKSNENLNGSRIRVIDIQGRLILQDQLSSHEIDLSTSPAGLYQITVFIKNEVKQFLVEKID